MQASDIWRALLWALPLAVLLGCWIRGLWEPRHPESTHAGLGDGPHTLSVLLLSDLHTGFCRVPAAEMVRAIRETAPDLVLHGGDACSSHRDTEAAIHLLKELGDAAKACGIPSYAVRGNHDETIPDEAFARAGLTLLTNRVVEVRAKDGSRWALCGLDDLRKGLPSIPDEDAFPRDIPADRTVLAAHNPDAFFMLSTNRFRFLLSGHFHGGQIWAPFNLEFRLLRREGMAADGYRRGAFERDGLLGYISRGIGCVVFPLRFRSRPEIPLVVLKSGIEMEESTHG